MPSYNVKSTQLRIISASFIFLCFTSISYSTEIKRDLTPVEQADRWLSKFVGIPLKEGQSKYPSSAEDFFNQAKEQKVTIPIKTRIKIIKNLEVAYKFRELLYETSLLYFLNEYTWDERRQFNFFLTLLVKTLSARYNVDIGHVYIYDSSGGFNNYGLGTETTIEEASLSPMYFENDYYHPNDFRFGVYITNYSDLEENFYPGIPIIIDGKFYGTLSFNFPMQ